MFSKKGFTLIEILIAIAIIGILSSVVMVSMNKARERASKTSAIASAKSVMPELLQCLEDYGYVSDYGIGNVICVDGLGSTVPIEGYSAVWPDISKTGWTMNVVSTQLDETYSYTISKETETVVCSLQTNACE